MFLQDTCKPQDAKLSAIGKAYRGTVDTSLMDKDAWISASELGWLNELK